MNANLGHASLREVTETERVAIEGGNPLAWFVKWAVLDTIKNAPGAIERMVKDVVENNKKD